MAGLVATDQYKVPGVQVNDLVARTCALTGRFGEVCQRYDPHTGETKWCPFMYGLRIHLQQRYAAEVRTPEDAGQWMATHELQETRSYQVMCLHAVAAIDPGATRPR